MKLTWKLVPENWMALVLWTKKVVQHSEKNLMRHYSRSLKDSDAKTYEDQGSRGFRGDNIPIVLETNVVILWLRM